MDTCNKNTDSSTSMDRTQDGSDKPVGDNAKINADNAGTSPEVDTCDKPVDSNAKTTEETVKVATEVDEPDNLKNNGDTAPVSTEVSDKDVSEKPVDENVKNDNVPKIFIKAASQDDTGDKPVDENVKNDDIANISLEVDDQKDTNDKSGDENVKNDVAKVSIDVDDQKDTSDKPADNVKSNEDDLKVSTEVDGNKDAGDTSVDSTTTNGNDVKITTDTAADENAGDDGSIKNNQEISESVEIDRREDSEIDRIKSSEEISESFTETTKKQDGDVRPEDNDEKGKDTTEILTEITERKDSDIPVDDLTETDGNKGVDVLGESDVKIGVDANEEISTGLGDSKDVDLELVEHKTEQIPDVEVTSSPVSIEQITSEIETKTSIIDDSPSAPVLQPITRDGKGMDPDIRKSLEKYLDDNGIRNYTMTMGPGSNVGENMVGIIAAIQVNGTNTTGSDVQLNWVAKIAPQLELFRKMIKIELIFEREIYMYQTVFPAFRALEDEKSIVDYFDSYPKFVFAYMEPYKESFVMNDMKSIGYVLKNKREPLDIDHVKLVMKTYGRLHALSYALKQNKPDVFATLTNNTQDIFKANITDMDEFKKGHRFFIDNARATLDPVKDAFLLTKFAQYGNHFLDVFVGDKELTNKYSVIGHGDSWINNMLFKYDNASHPTTPTAVCFLDFQLAKFGSPACDLSYFIFTCTDKAFRDEHYNTMIKLYYYTLCAHLNDLGCDPEIHLPFHALETELKKFAVVGLHMSLIALMAMTREAEEIGDWQSNQSEEEIVKISLAKSKNQHLYNERVRDIIIDFAHRSYFDYLNYFQ